MSGQFKWRPVRGSLSEALKESRTFETMNELFAILQSRERIGFYYQCYDSRPDWDAPSYLVVSTKGPRGYVSGIPEMKT